MKVNGAKKVHYDSGPNMTPLVDVVMVILIFLMLAGSFGETEKFLVSDVPVEKVGAGGPPKDGVPIPTKFTIKVSQDNVGSYTATAGKFLTVKSYPDATKAYDTLYSELSSQLKTYESIGKTADDVQVLIYPASQVSLDNLLTVYQAALDAGFKKVGFGVGGN